MPLRAVINYRVHFSHIMSWCGCSVKIIYLAEYDTTEISKSIPGSKQTYCIIFSSDMAIVFTCKCNQSRSTSRD